MADGGCDGYRPDDIGRGRGNRPVFNVSWDDVQTYVAWLSEKTGKTYRLLSEAEWEYVARAGSETLYSWGNEIEVEDIKNRATCSVCTHSKSSAPVGSFAANAFGLHDVHGNVWELVQDCWNETYAGAPADGSAWEQGDCNRRMIRGGSWYTGSMYLRFAFRGRFTTGNRDNQLGHIGFRVARSLTP